jgi:hypothetical protein
VRECCVIFKLTSEWGRYKEEHNIHNVLDALLKHETLLLIGERVIPILLRPWCLSTRARTHAGPLSKHFFYFLFFLEVYSHPSGQEIQVVL